MKKITMAALAVFTLISSVQARPWSEIQSSKTVLVVTDPGNPPFTDNENGRVVGFEIDLGNAIFKKMGFTVKWQTLRFDHLVPALLKREYDMAMASQTITKERMEKVDFSSPTYCTGLVFITKPGIPKEVTELKEYTIFAQTGSTGEMYLSKQHFPKIRRLTTRNSVNSQLTMGVADAIIDDEMAGRALSNSPLGKQKKLEVSELLTTDKIAASFPKGSDELRKVFNEGLSKVINDGTYAELIKKWLPRDMRCK